MAYSIYDANVHKMLAFVKDGKTVKEDLYPSDLYNEYKFPVSCMDSSGRVRSGHDVFLFDSRHTDHYRDSIVFIFMYKNTEWDIPGDDES